MIFTIPYMLVLKWTGTWWSGVDDKKVRERKRLIALVGPLMDQNLVAQGVRERKRLMSPGLRGKPTEPCSQGSRCCT